MMLNDALFLLAASVAGGVANAIAGGGTFFTFPALVAVGLDPLTANISNSVSTCAGHGAAIPAYRNELRRAGLGLLPRSIVVGAGGLCGAGALLLAGGRTFTALVPWLLIIATVIFAAGPTINRLSRRYARQMDAPWVIGIMEFMVAVYGGYFGAGQGVLMMAVLAIVGVDDVQSANAQKNWLATIVTVISVSVFMLAGVIVWLPTALVVAGGLTGGYLGGRIARFIPAKLLRGVIISTGAALSIFYIYK